MKYDNFDNHHQQTSRDHIQQILNN